MKVYYYSKKELLPLILKEGLEIIPSDEILILEAPEPKEWVKNKFFPRFWEDIFKPLFVKDTILLEITLDNEDIKMAFVRDYIHIIKYEPRILPYDSDFPKEYDYKSEKIARKNLKDTRISLIFYLAHKDNLKYKLPQILLTKSINYNNIKILSKKSLFGLLLGYVKSKNI